MRTSHDSETLAPGQQVIVACAFIYRFGDSGPEVFLPKRAATKKFLPGVFELPGGHVDYGESPQAALVREIDEELQCTVRVGMPFATFSYLNRVKGSHSTEIIFFARFESGADDEMLREPLLNPEDHSEFVWLPRERLTEMLVGGKTEEDEEFQAILEGFRLLGAGVSGLGA